MNQNKMDELATVSQLDPQTLGSETRAAKLALELVIEWMTNNKRTEILVDDENPIPCYALSVDDDDLDQAVGWLPRSVFDDLETKPVVRLNRLTEYLKG